MLADWLINKLTWKNKIKPSEKILNERFRIRMKLSMGNFKLHADMAKYTRQSDKAVPNRTISNTWTCTYRSTVSSASSGPECVQQGVWSRSGGSLGEHSKYSWSRREGGTAGVDAPGRKEGQAEVQNSWCSVEACWRTLLHAEGNKPASGTPSQPVEKSLTASVAQKHSFFYTFHIPLLMQLILSFHKPA